MSIRMDERSHERACINYCEIIDNVERLAA